jgi:hypothetical protein
MAGQVQALHLFTFAAACELHFSAPEPILRLQHLQLQCWRFTLSAGAFF